MQLMEYQRVICIHRVSAYNYYDNTKKTVGVVLSSMNAFYLQFKIISMPFPENWWKNLCKEGYLRHTVYH